MLFVSCSFFIPDFTCSIAVIILYVRDFVCLYLKSFLSCFCFFDQQSE